MVAATVFLHIIGYVVAAGIARHFIHTTAYIVAAGIARHF